MLYNWEDFGFYGVAKGEPIKSATLVRNDLGVPLSIIDERKLVQPMVKSGQLRLIPICNLKPNETVVVGHFNGADLSTLIATTHGKIDWRIKHLPEAVH